LYNHESGKRARGEESRNEWRGRGEEDERRGKCLLRIL